MTTTERGVLVPRWAMQDCDGDPRDAMLLAQITWWFQPAQRDGSPRTTHLVDRGGATWMYTTDAELAEQTGMSVGQVYRARRALLKRGLVEARSALVDGQKVTLIRSVLEPDDDEPIAESRNPDSAETRNLGNRENAESDSAKTRNPPIEKRDRRLEKNARAEALDLGWQVPEVVASGGRLEDAVKLCEHWASRLEERGVRVGDRVRSKAWVTPMEALLRIDGREEHAVQLVIDWLEDGRDDVAGFWRANVLSPDKLRSRWDQMSQQYRRERGRQAGSGKARQQSEWANEYMAEAQRLWEQEEAAK